MSSTWQSACIVLVLAVASVSAGPAAGGGQPGSDRVIDAEELPISLERIKRKLDRLPDSDQERSMLRLSYYVEVYGRAPRINVMEGFDVHNGPVPYSAPSHADMLAVTTPIEFSSPAANIGNVIGWAWKGF